MFKDIFSSLPVLGHMLYADFLIFRPAYLDRLFDFFIYVSINLVVMGYLLTGFGMRADYGIFMAATLVATGALFEVFPCAVNIVSDLTGNKIISYDITLPLPSWMAVARIGLSNAIRGLAIGIFALPFGLLFVGNQFDSSNFSPAWFITLFIANTFFYGYFSVFLASFVPHMGKIGSMWMRVMFPLWILGCFQFSWQVVYAKYPIFAHVILLNPFVYTIEGMRAAVLGQEGSLPMWACLGATLLAALVCGVIGVKRMLKRLDAV